MSDEANKKARKVKIGPARMSFPSLIKPRKTKNDDGTEKEQYELTLLVPPAAAEQTRKDLMRAFTAVMTEKFGAKDQWPKMRRKPADVLKDFDEYNRETAKTTLPGDWKGWLMIRANGNTKNPPGVVGPVKGEDGKFPVITDEREVYGGRWCNATVEAFYFTHKGGGLSLGLGNVQLLKHDKKFGGAVTAKAEEDFDNASDEWAGAGDAFDSGEAASGGADEDAPW